MNRLSIIAAILLLAAPIGCGQPAPPAALTATTTPTVYQGPCDVLAAAGNPCVDAQNLARPALAAYKGPFYQVQNGDYAVIYDHTSSGNDLTVDGAYHKSLTPIGWTTPPSGMTVAIARIVPGEGYYRSGPGCGVGCATSNMPAGNAAITMYMVIEDNSEGGSINGCCSGFSDSESPTRDAGKGFMFGPSYATGGMCTFGSGSGPWVGVDLEDGNCLYGSTPTQKYMTILAKYDPSTGTMTLKSGDATKGSLTPLYSGPLPAGYSKLSLEQGISLGRGGDGSNAPINFIEGGIIAATTTDAADNALQANIVNFYGPAL